MTFTNPMKDVRITSNFGWRTVGGVKDYHKGIDIVPTKGDKTIYASCNGTIRLARWMDGYGNVIIITHKVDNKTIETVYAHLSKINVKSGQVVKQGQAIGVMGKTGGSKANPNYKMGEHLHFEIHNGVWASKQPNAIDPKTYVDFSKNFNDERFNVVVGQFTNENAHLGKALSEELTKRGYYNIIQKL